MPCRTGKDETERSRRHLDGKEVDRCKGVGVKVTRLDSSRQVRLRTSSRKALSGQPDSAPCGVATINSLPATPSCSPSTTRLQPVSASTARTTAAVRPVAGGFKADLRPRWRPVVHALSNLATRAATRHRDADDCVLAPPHAGPREGCDASTPHNHQLLIRDSRLV